MTYYPDTKSADDLFPPTNLDRLAHLERKVRELEQRAEVEDEVRWLKEDVKELRRRIEDLERGGEL